MRFGFRAISVVSLSLLLAMACVGGENQCLNPQPDLPSCSANGRPPNTAGSPATSAGGSRSDDNGNGQSAGSPAIIVGGSGNPGGEPEFPTPGAAAGESGLAGAGGDTAGIPNGEAGAGGAAGAAGAEDWR